MLVNSWNRAQTMLPGQGPARKSIDQSIDQRTKSTPNMLGLNRGRNLWKATGLLVVQTTIQIGNKLALYRLIKLRRRHILTRHNKLRLRYVAGLSAIALAGLVTLFGAALPSEAFVRYDAKYVGQDRIDPMISLSQNEDALPDEGGIIQPEETIPENKKNKIRTRPVLAGFARTVDEIIREGKAVVIHAGPPAPRTRSLEVGRGDTVAGVLQEAGVSGPDAYKAVKALSARYDPRKVKPGQRVELDLEPDGDGAYALSKMAMKIDAVKDVVVRRGEDETFKAQIEEKDVIERSYTGYANIQTSLYGSAQQAGIPVPVITEIIRAYSWGVDFQRDIRHGDKIEVLYNRYETEDGDVVRTGDVLYVNLSVGGKDIPIYRFEKSNGDVDYYEEDGRSIRKTLMKTPIDGARLSSGFGMRRHPVLGYNKMHKGIDFAAPMGTPVYAAGDGTIEKAGRNGGYGNYVRIRHNGELKTAYAHLHKFAKSVGKGKRVKQGQVIAYVGTTGRSTGPHLHYEVLKGGVQVNPSRVDLPVGEKLKGKELARFKDAMKSLQRQYVESSGGLKLARREDKKENKKLR